MIINCYNIRSRRCPRETKTIGVAILELVCISFLERYKSRCDTQGRSICAANKYLCIYGRFTRLGGDSSRSNSLGSNYAMKDRCHGIIGGHPFDICRLANDIYGGDIAYLHLQRVRLQRKADGRFAPDEAGGANKKDKKCYFFHVVLFLLSNEEVISLLKAVGGVYFL